MPNRTAIARRPRSEHDALIANLMVATVDPARFIEAVHVLYDASREGRTGPDLDQLTDLVRTTVAISDPELVDVALGFVLQKELEERLPSNFEPGDFGLAGVQALITWWEAEFSRARAA